MREKIIDATVEEFKQNGLKFTMNDLAKRLGISKKTIYTVFESKQAVLVAVADRYAADLYSMQEELEADVSLNVVQKLEKLLCALPEKYSNIGLSRIYELAEKYPKPYRHLMRSVNNGWEQAEKYLEKGMEEGMRMVYCELLRLGEGDEVQPEVLDVIRLLAALFEGFGGEDAPIAQCSPRDALMRMERGD